MSGCFHNDDALPELAAECDERRLPDEREEMLDRALGEDRCEERLDGLCFEDPLDRLGAGEDEDDMAEDSEDCGCTGSKRGKRCSAGWWVFFARAGFFMFREGMGWFFQEGRRPAAL